MQIAPGHQAGGAERLRQIIGQRRVRGKRLEVQHGVAGPARAQTSDQRGERRAAAVAIHDRSVAQRVVVAETAEAARAKERRVALAMAADQARGRTVVGSHAGEDEPLLGVEGSGGQRLEPGPAEAEVLRAGPGKQGIVAGRQLIPGRISPKLHAQDGLVLRQGSSSPIMAP